MPRLTVPPPSHEPSPYGLLSVVEARYDEPGPHWRTGVQWQPLCGDLATTYDPCLAVTGTGGPPPVPPPKSSNLTFETRGATPFTVYADFQCSPAATAGDAERQAQEAMRRFEAWQVEHAFWTGLAGGSGTVPQVTAVYPHLAADAEVRDPYGTLLQTASDPVTGAVLDVVEGLGRLEQALVTCLGGVGVIHVPAVLAPALDAQGLLHPSKDGRQFRTGNGNLVAVGSGYPGTSPSGTTPSAGSAWMYATGPVFAYRSRVEILGLPSIVNRANNTVEAIAERTYVLGFDCCLHAVLISTGGVVSGAGDSVGSGDDPGGVA
jgi:hypothetical protein